MTTTSTEQDADLQNRMRRLDDLLREVEATSDSAERARTSQVIQSLMDFHSAGISAIVARLNASGDAGRAILNDLAQNDLVASLLLLYDLHPLTLESRVRLALDKVRPPIASRGRTVTLLDITPDGVVHLRMDGTGHACAGTMATLKTTIEQAILEKAPDATSVEIDTTSDDNAAGATGFVPIEQLTQRLGDHHRPTEGVLHHAS